MKIIKKHSFIILLALMFLAADFLLNACDPVGNSYLFPKNDFEKIQAVHPEPSYDKVIFGNSAIVSAYIEGQSKSGYANLGILYGKITDLKAMLEQGRVAVSSDIVLALNYFTLMDTLPTNPSYIWHKRHAEPYAYFQRDRLSVFVSDWFNALIAPDGPPDGEYLKKYYDLNKYLPYEVLTDSQLDEKVAAYRESYWWQPISSFRDNLNALEWLAGYCEQNNIRLRALWMPWNAYAKQPEISLLVTDEANAVLESQNIDVLDWTTKFDGMDRRVFHDLGHLTYNFGAPIFTEELDKWLTE